MGVQQFYSPLKNDVDQIHADTIAIHQDTQDIKNTDLANVSNNMIENKKGKTSGNLQPSHYSYSFLDITGAGILVSITNNDVNYAASLMLEIDNDGKYIPLSIPVGCCVTYLFRFKTRLKITSSNATPTGYVQYLLD